MATRQAGKTITMRPEPEDSTPELPTQRARPETGRYRLQVDRQTKASYTTLEAAEEAAAAIKKAHPILQVAVYDPVASLNKIIEPHAAPDPTVGKDRDGRQKAEDKNRT
jgi:hypothetical protein